MIRDLLGENPTEFLDLREDPVKGLSVAGLIERTGDTSEEVMKYLFIGNKNRTQESTGANEVSSRSHAVFQITVDYTDKGEKTDGETKSGKLSMIDLAGSERAASTQNRGIRMVEGANINRSLLALGNCINKLSDQMVKGLRLYIPYRDSKLTRLLKDSLGGNCQTVMIANISPSNATYEDTHNTLKYANRAKNIKTKLIKNVRTVQYHIAQYTQVITQLKQEVVNLRKQLAISKSTSGSMQRIFKNCVELACSPQVLEEEVQKLLEEINEHHSEEGNVRKSLYKIRQKIETLSYLIMVRKSNYESLTKDDESADELLKEISGNEIQLKQLIINEEVLLNRMRELGRNREHMLNAIRQRQMLVENWISMLAKQLEHEKNVVAHIPTDGDVISAEAQSMAQRQNEIIERLKEQLVLRDDMIARVKSEFKQRNAELDTDQTGLMVYEDIVKFAQDERNAKARNFTLPTIQQSYASPNDKLFTRIPRFKLPRKQANINNLYQAGEIIVSSKIVKKKEGRDDKRSYSVVSQNSSFSTGASTGAAPLGKIVSLLSKPKQVSRQNGNKMSHRQLLNAGTHIAIGGLHKFQVKKERSHFALGELKPISKFAGKLMSEHQDNAI